MYAGHRTTLKHKQAVGTMKDIISFPPALTEHTHTHTKTKDKLYVCLPTYISFALTVVHCEPLLPQQQPLAHIRPRKRWLSGGGNFAEASERQTLSPNPGSVPGCSLPEMATGCSPFTVSCRKADEMRHDLSCGK